MAERRVENARAEVDEIYTEISKLLDGQRRRVATLVSRDASCGSGGRDGFSAGGGGLGQKNGISDSAGNAAASNVDPFDPVENRKPVDKVHQRAVACMRAARDARDQLLIIDGQLAKMDDSLADARPPEPCESCARADRVASMEISTTAAMRLERFYDLCHWCYKRVCRTGKLPTVEQVQRRHDR